MNDWLDRNQDYVSVRTEALVAFIRVLAKTIRESADVESFLSSLGSYVEADDESNPLLQDADVRGLRHLQELLAEAVRRGVVDNTLDGS